MVAKENVVDACDEAKLNFFPHPATTFINPCKLESLQGLNLSKYGFIIELVIKSDIITVDIQMMRFILKFFLSWFQSQYIRSTYNGIHTYLLLISIMIPSRFS